MTGDNSHRSSAGAFRDLNALLGSRICHDLISPLGAIGNGVELLALTGVSAAPEIALISESVENANARIRFFRVAFGAAEADQTVSAIDIRSILTDTARGGRLRYIWRPDGDLPRAEVKLAFLLLQCLESAMPWGGTVEISRQQGRWVLAGTADRTKLDTDLWELLVNPSTEIRVTASDVHFALVSEAANRAGRHLQTDLRDKSIRITF